MADTVPTAAAPTGVPIRTPEGELRRVDPKDLQQALSAGASQVSEQEVAHEKNQQEFGGLGGQAATFGINAADALALGFGKGAVTQIAGAIDPSTGRRVARAIQGYDEANPNAAIAGTITGALAPAVFTGGASAEAEGAGMLSKGARILGAPTRALSALGEGATTGVAGLLGKESEGLFGRMLQKGLAGAAGGTVEGSIYGVGGAYSEAELQDKELTAENLLSGAAKGALFGAALGGGMSAGGELVGTAARKAVDTAQSFGVGEKSLQDYANELRFSSTGARTPEIRRVEASGLERKDLGQWMADNLPSYNEGKPPLAKESILKASQAATEDFGNQIGNSIEALDTAAAQTGTHPDALKFFQRMKDEVLTPFEGQIGQSGTADRLAKVMNDVQKRMGYEMSDAGQMVKVRDISFSDVNQIRREVDNLAYKESKILSTDTMTDQLRALRGTIEDEVREQGAKVAGPEWLRAYEDANHNYRMATAVRDSTDHALDRINGNRGISLTDTIAGAGTPGMSVGLASLGHPVAAAANLASGLASMVGNKVLRTYGDAVGAQILSRIAKMESIKGVTLASSEALAGKVSKAMGGVVRRSADMLYTKPRNDFDIRTKQIAAMASNPAMVAPMPHSDVAPQTATIFASKQANAIQYLNSQIPQGYVVKSPLTPTLKNKPTMTEQKAFLRKLAVYDDPHVVLTEMQHGTLTYEHVDALKAMYPATYRDIQTKVSASLADLAAKGKSPPYATRIQLGMLLDVPADPALEPGFIAAQQATYATPEPAPHHASLQGVKPAPSMATESERIEAT